MIGRIKPEYVIMLLFTVDLYESARHIVLARSNVIIILVTAWITSGSIAGCEHMIASFDILSVVNYNKGIV